MKKETNKKKQFELNKRKKLLRRKRRKNRSKRGREYNKSNTKDTFIINTSAVKSYLELSGFGKTKGERILKDNGIEHGVKSPGTLEKVIIRAPKVLSFLEDSDSVLDFLQDCYGLIKNRSINELVFDHTGCEDIDLAASTFMDVVIMTVLDEYGLNKNNFMRTKKWDAAIIRGIMSNNSDISKVLVASGLPKHLNADYFGNNDVGEGVETLDVITGISGRPNKTSSIYATRLTNYFEKCLHKEGMSLSVSGNKYFTELFGEVLSNCEIHGGKMATWYSQGVYLNKGRGGEMQLLFMTIGETIYQGLMNSSIETQQRLIKLYAKHRDHISKVWTKEMLYTLFSLQDGISRLRNKAIEGYKFRGSGTVTMIDTLQTIGAKDKEYRPQMTIISGNTRIVFDEKYTLKEEQFNDEIMGKGLRKVIAFNDRNDIYFPPDESYVKRCKNRFPGTLISIKFLLDRDYIETRKKI